MWTNLNEMCSSCKSGTTQNEHCMGSGYSHIKMSIVWAQATVTSKYTSLKTGAESQGACS